MENGDAALRLDSAVARRSLVGILALAVLVRMMHLAAALRSPTTFFLGPDEDFYRRFGQAVAFGNGGFSAEFAFMDPLYGYLLGAVFSVTGDSLFPVFLLQIFADTATAALLFAIGRELGRPRAGLFAAAAYALCATAVMFALTVLKATWVSLFLASWMFTALVALRSGRMRTWLWFGLLCGAGIALRANLLLMLLMALPLPFLTGVRGEPGTARRLRQSFGVVLGALLPLALLLARNVQISDSWSPLPNNGGVVLHQVYNEHNPESRSSAPPFVPRMHPDDIWRAYADEANLRTGRALAPQQVDRYWREQAIAYIATHKAQSVANIWRKFRELSAWPEVPNNRSLQDERLFSVVLRILPSPFGWLMAFGIPGVALLIWKDRKGAIVLAPLLMATATVVIFFAESRFRFGAVPSLALGVGVVIDHFLRSAGHRRWRQLLGVSLVTLALGIVSHANARLIPIQPTNWHRIAWGYVKLGEYDLAEDWATSAPQQSGRLAYQKHELLGFVALQRKQREHAMQELLAAANLRPDLPHLRQNLLIASRLPP